MLIKNPNERIDVYKAFNHPWLQKASENLNLVDEEKEIIQRIGNFKFKNKLEAVVYTFIVSQLLSTEEKSLFIQIFE